MLYAFLGLAVAVSPVGGWIARAWESTPLLTGVLGGLVLAVAAYLGRWVTPRISALPRLPLWVDRLMAWFNKLFSRPTPVLLLVVFHGADLSVTAAACVLGGVMTAITAHNVYVRRAPQQRLAETSYAVIALPSMPARQRAIVMRDWLQRTVLRRPRRPDLVLIHGICGWAQATSQSRPWPGQSLQIRQKLFSGWQPLVEEFLELVAIEGMVSIRGRRSLALEQALQAARIVFITTKSVILENIDLREESAAALHELVALAERSGDSNDVVVATALAAGYEGTRLGLTEQALLKLERLMQHEDLRVEARAIVLIATISVVAMRRDRRAARRYTAELERLVRSLSSRQRGPLAGIIKQAAAVTIEASHGILPEGSDSSDRDPDEGRIDHP
jgi:hypothetical protein